MINTTYLAALTQSIEDAHDTDPVVERWVDRAKELQKELSLRVLTLSRYVDELPEASYASYADTLTSVLQDPELDSHIEEMSDLKNKLEELAGRLEKRGLSEKA